MSDNNRLIDNLLNSTSDKNMGFITAVQDVETFIGNRDAELSNIIQDLEETLNTNTDWTRRVEIALGKLKKLQRRY